MISFDWWTGAEDPLNNETMRFTVYGSIMNSNPAGVPQAAYQFGAKSNWGQFVENYIGTAGGYPGDGSWAWIN
ncbi:hypothetical protein [Cryobacterium melibiosiphilum]|uniref:hypothetical protein n=1 Tax=Cryobacterium melibiosiphilum TaxID=995039 RepID=UPI0011C21590